MKRTVIYLGLLVACVHCATVNAQPIKKHCALHVEGTKLLDQNNQSVVLRGMSFGWHNFWPRFYNKDVVSWLHKDWNCTVVRAAMGIDLKGGYLEDSATALEKVMNVVNAAIKEGIYVIIDWHCHNIHVSEAKAFFADMAKLYGDYPNVIYEIFNEPDDETWSAVKEYSRNIIDTIRKYDPDNIILVGSPHWDQDVDLVANDPLVNYNNIMYTMHFYAATHKQFLRDKCNAALRKRLPLFISESAGMEASGDGPVNDEEWSRWITWAEENKISWITWSVSDKNETCSVLYPSADSNGRWQKEDLKSSGIKARQLLKKYNR